jgi:hypothetical protein
MVNNQRKVTVLLPSLNAREFLEPRIDSLLSQTFSDWEAIVLDSGSTDGSWDFFQSVASKDSRFQLHQIPREGLYAALNRGLKIADGQFLYFAPCDDTMSPEFLSEMLDAFSKCPEARIAVCDALFINRHGDKLSAKDLRSHLSRGGIRRLLSSNTVRTAIPGEKKQNINYRPPPHDCVLHYTGRSVYYSLTQLLVRADVAIAAGPFEANVGSVADLIWLLRLTNLTGTVHVPRKLATWRFHGEQLSIHRDSSRPASISAMCKQLLPEIRQRHQRELTSDDFALLLLGCDIVGVESVASKIGYWLEGVLRLIWLFIQRPSGMWKIFRVAGWRILNLRQYLPTVVLSTHGLAPKDL